MDHRQGRFDLGGVVRRSPHGIARSILVILGCGAAYGAALGAWTGWRLAVYAAVKLPIVLLATAAVTLVFNTAAATVLGSRARLHDVTAVTLGGMAMAALLLASVVPVILLFDVSLPAAGDESRTTHNMLYLLHTVAVGTAGLAGVGVMWRALRTLSGSRRTAVRVLLVWVLSLAAVGGEVAWALRPFVGSVYLQVVFIRPDALDGNVYEFIWTDIRPHLLRLDGGGGEDDARE